MLVQPRPGTDGALALGVAHLLVKNGWIDRGSSRPTCSASTTFARRVRECTPAWAAAIGGVPESRRSGRWPSAIGTVRPAHINAGFGMQRYTNAGQAMRAIIALLAVTGNIGKPGRRLGLREPPDAPLRRDEGPARLLPAESAGRRRSCHDLDRALGPRHAGAERPAPADDWVERGNPIRRTPRPNRAAAFRGLDFRVVVDEFLTDTAREADIVLPAKTIFEQTDVIGAYWHAIFSSSRRSSSRPAR